MQLEQLKQVVEVLIFASDVPLPAEQVKQIVEDADTDAIARAVEELNQDYRNTDRTFQIVHVAGGFQLVTHENYAAWVRKLFQGRLKTKLSQAGMETLSVIAFKQPVSKPEIEAIRGVNCDAVIRTLLERKLITISGREDGPGRPLLFKTTREFLRYFGVNEISDLPKPKEIDELFKENGVQQNLLADLPDGLPLADGNAVPGKAAAEAEPPRQEEAFPAETDPGEDPGVNQDLTSIAPDLDSPAVESGSRFEDAEARNADSPGVSGASDAAE